jgi:tetratricopeptide (TPR) repeat protein
MKNSHCSRLLIMGFCSLFILSACDKKRAFLDEKPNSEIFTPKTITDLQALLDNDIYINEMPEIGTLSGDEYYLMNGFWETLPAKERNCYIWSKDIFEGQGKVQDWNLPYKQVLYANIVLDQLAKGVSGEASARDINYIQGAALFVRGLAFFNIAQHFAEAYDESDANKPGIPIRLTPDMEEESPRATLKATYDQIISDISAASKLLPDSLPYLNRNRPGKAASFAALSRIYLSMRSYEKAGKAADSSLKYYNRIIDYNSINQSAFLPFSPLNDETIYQARLLSSSRVLVGVSFPACVIDSGLYRSYEANDLRKPIYFIMNSSNLPNMKGGYSGTIVPFGGLAVDEVVLIKAECEAREDKVQEAMNRLNALLRNRWKRGTYVDRIASTREDALNLILMERRKELVFRGVRWSDLKRLNKEGTNITLTRKLGGVTYKLTPNDPKYILPIPPDVLALGGIEPNHR